MEWMGSTRKVLPSTLRDGVVLLPRNVSIGGSIPVVVSVASRCGDLGGRIGDEVSSRGSWTSGPGSMGPGTEGRAGSGSSVGREGEPVTVRERPRMRGRRARLTVLARLELLVTERTDGGLCADIAVSG